MALLFYLIFIWFTDVNFSWGWFFVALLFSFESARYVYVNKHGEEFSTKEELEDDDLDDEE